MKRFICLLLILLLCVGLAACSSDSNQKKANDTASGVQSAVEDQVSATEASDASAKSSGKYATIQEYLDTPAKKEALDALNDPESGVGLHVYGDGDTLVYDFTFTEHIGDDRLSSVKETLQSSLEEESSYSSYGAALDEIKGMVNVENPKAQVVFHNDDGSVIAEKIYE